MRAILAAGLLAAGLSSSHAASQSSAAAWRDVEPEAIVERGARLLAPRRFRTLALDESALRGWLAAAPPESAVAARHSPLEVLLPHPDGGFARFRVVESPVMAPALAARFPEIRTWMGQGVDDPAASVRFDLTPAGFRAQVLTAGGSWYVDPWQSGDRVHHIAYLRAEHARGDAPVRSCEVLDGPGGKAKDAPHFAPHLAAPKVSSGATLRTYRLAVAATGEYTTFHGGTVAGGLGAIVSTINRVNGIYEREVAVRMVLVADNDRIVYTDGAADPYNNSDGLALLGQNQANLDAVIGSANYDIGHVFSTGGGGVATLASVCLAGSKARGVTGSGAPVGDAFDVDYVAHEIGHQFNAPHTFNSAVASCSGGNRSASSAFETGSGVSIMAYAGICGAENLQPNSEDHFHRDSLNRILAFTSTDGGTCGVSSATGNAPPTVTAPAPVTIPRLTPFTLVATGSDIDGDTLTWLWEQYDLGAATSGGGLVDNGTRPILRPLAPARGPSRVFPDVRFILGNANVVPATASLPGTTSPAFYAGETLPAAARTLNFRVTARDNRAGGGGTNEAALAVTVAAAGPFRVNAPNTTVSWAAGSTQTVSWDVAGTSAAPVNTANVRLTLSVDGGATFPVVLSASTPNSGSASLTVPANTAATNRARVRIEAVGNIFFDVSDADFAITSAGNAAPSITPNGSSVSVRQGGSANAVVASVADAQDAAGSLAVAAAGTPPELTVAASNSAGSVGLSANAACSLVAPTSGARSYPVQITVSDAQGATTTTSVNVNVSTNRAPTLGLYPNTLVGSGASTTVSPAAAPADPDGNLATTVVAPATLAGGGTLSVNAAGVVAVTAGTTSGIFPVRVTTTDACGASRVQSFDQQVDVAGLVFRNGFEP
ncbi:MAG: reprolysin-like metallopeptidase [Pseudomonadota bacterium]